jgi:transcriptional regulator with XRE-family HTH domain
VESVLSAPNLTENLSVQALFASELRRYRVERHLTQEELAKQVYCSSGLVSMIETGKRAPNKDFTNRCDEVLETGGALIRLWPLLTKEAYPSWFRPFVEMEAEATAIHEFEVQAMPGLLQTEDYARTVIDASWPPNDEHETESQLAARMERQEVLNRKNPPLLWVVLDEAVLRRPIGGPTVMAGQLTHLIEMAARLNIRIQVLPFSKGVHAAMDGAFELLDIPKDKRAVYVEGPGTGQLIINPDLVAQLRLRFDALRGLALSPEESIDLIATTLGEL